MAAKEKSSKGIAGDGFPAGRGEEGDRTGDLFSQAERADLGIKEMAGRHRMGAHQASQISRSLIQASRIL